jgi:hypothetical protein
VLEFFGLGFTMEVPWWLNLPWQQGFEFGGDLELVRGSSLLFGRGILVLSAPPCDGEQD